MATSRYAGKDCWPTRQQELLLQAALMRGPKAFEAWNQWRSSVDIEKLDPESLRLLPQLHDTLRREGVSDSRGDGRQTMPWREACQTPT